MLQHSLVVLCDKTKNQWQQMDPDVTMATNIDDKCMGIIQAVSYVAGQLKLHKNVCKSLYLFDNILPVLMCISTSLNP